MKVKPEALRVSTKYLALAIAFLAIQFRPILPPNSYINHRSSEIQGGKAVNPITYIPDAGFLKRYLYIQHLSDEALQQT